MPSAARSTLARREAISCGDEMTLADFFGAPILSQFELIHASLMPFENVTRWMGGNAQTPCLGQCACNAQTVRSFAGRSGVRNTLTPKPSVQRGSTTLELDGNSRRARHGIAMSWRPLGQCEHFSAENDVFHRILRVTRISDAYPHTRALLDAHNWLLKLFQGFDRPKVVLVWDGRRGKLRNDPEFEEAMKQVLPAVTEGWREFISINNAPVVKVQFFRWTREGIACPIRTFNDEREALNYAVEVSTSSPS